MFQSFLMSVAVLLSHAISGIRTGMISCWESEDEEMWSVGISRDQLKIPTWCTGKPTDVFNILRLMQPAGLETQAPWQAEGTWVKCVFKPNGADCLPAGCAVFCCGVLSCSQQRPGQLRLNNKRPQKKNHVSVRPSWPHPHQPRCSLSCHSGLIWVSTFSVRTTSGMTKGTEKWDWMINYIMECYFLYLSDTQSFCCVSGRQEDGLLESRPPASPSPTSQTSQTGWTSAWIAAEGWAGGSRTFKETLTLRPTSCWASKKLIFDCNRDLKAMHQHSNMFDFQLSKSLVSEALTMFTRADN